MKTKNLFLIRRRIKALKTFFISKTLRKEALNLAVGHLYTRAEKARQKLFSISLEELLFSSPLIQLTPYSRVDGNLSYYELIVLSSLASTLKPQKLLEIGTFNGLSTLHLALNTPENASIHTLDLCALDPSHPADEADKPYILDLQKAHKKYQGFACAGKIKEHQGNSFDYPFKSFGEPDFIFIDGGHSYENVKNDTESSLKILSPKGCILWHDYTPDCPGVFDYLNSLGSFYPIQHIQGTSFAYYQKATLADHNI